VRTRTRGPFYVYVLTSSNKTLYISVTNNLTFRVARLKEGTGSAFTAKYGVNQLVYVKEFSSITDAITREKQLEGWTRARKIALIEQANPDWQDLGNP
jgi:putative endonuclease